MSAVAVIPAFNEEASLGGVLAEIAEIEGLVQVVVDEETLIARLPSPVRRRFVCPAALQSRGGGRSSDGSSVGSRTRSRHGGDRRRRRSARSGRRCSAACAIEAGAGLAIGSRFAADAGDYAVGGARRRAMRILNRLVRSTTGFAATDATSGFRAMNRPVWSISLASTRSNIWPTRLR